MFWIMMRDAALRRQAMLLLAIAAADMARSSAAEPPAPADNVVKLDDYRGRRAAK